MGAIPTLTKKREYTRNESDKERQSVCFPTPSIEKSGKNVTGGTVRSQIDQRDKDHKESDDMQDQNHSFNLGKPSRQICVDEDHKRNDSVEYQRSLPTSCLIARIV